MIKRDSNILLNAPSKDKWERVGAHRRAGAVVPLFCVHSKRSVGIGDFDDLKLVIDWCDKSGLSILQLMPMNEVGSTYCPYDALSSFALEPAYISLEALSAVAKNRSMPKISSLRKRFPCGEGHVDYGIKDAKKGLLTEIFLGADNSDSKELKKFEQDNSYWLDDFALFKAIKEANNGRPWYEWEEGYRNRDSVMLEDFRREHGKEVEFQRWLQWLAYSQFKSASAHAESKGIKLCGDLPILISRDSADAWTHPEFFNLDFAAGAPPDMYCAKGQRWGMPTYDWDRIRDDDYKYISDKLKFAEEFYDMLRIDHVAGLFRIWSIPYDEPLENEGLNGVFDPSEEKRWKGHGFQILSKMLESTSMLLIAEDLGIIPKVCPDTMRELGIPGNDVQRWAKDWKGRRDFLKPEEYRLISAAMLSTHDTTNWPAWWENEAGTVDEELFIRKCRDRGIDYDLVKKGLFDKELSRHGRLRWLTLIQSSAILINILGKKKEEVSDFIEIYEDTYNEKEKLWRHLKIKGPMREKSDAGIVAEALKITHDSRSIFCIESLLDHLFFANILKGDPYRYRINRPGTVSKKNWSLTIPISLEELSEHKICDDIRDMIKASGRLLK